ncbi:hypothetical protein LCGC14_0872960 [marine sediment metagenome]|uniref:Uncharacterized protein n=1 Tax=marine sediment metagenome TaxID=412755 RepID=A0A0F9SB46_9ZZZZ
MPLPNRIEIDIQWENNNTIDITAKNGSGTPYTVVKADENGHLEDMFPAIKDVMERYVKGIMEKIAADMKLP